MSSYVCMYSLGWSLVPALPASVRMFGGALRQHRSLRVPRQLGYELNWHGGRLRSQIAGFHSAIGVSSSAIRNPDLTSAGRSYHYTSYGQENCLDCSTSINFEHDSVACFSGIYAVGHDGFAQAA